MRNITDKCETKKKNTKRKMLIRLTISMLAVILLAFGVSKAWFVHENNIATLMQVTEPSSIAIRGPHGEALSSLDLSYTEDDKKGDTVTIKRVVSVSSDARRHKIEIVHTTNLKGLTFKIYPATEVTSKTDGSVTEGNYTYTYSTTPLNGHYININEENSTADYKYADGSKHSWNFDNYNQVQAHAEPIYWLANETQDGVKKDKTNTSVDSEYLNYYVIEISWTETEKETDIFYLLVQIDNK